MPQHFTIAELEDTLPTTLALLRQDAAAHPGTSKVMVFFPTARGTGLAASVLSRVRDLPPILEIHSRMSQPARTRSADSFKAAKSAVLLSSDVAARGMDFPG